jgi:general secretion pathway protein M
VANSSFNTFWQARSARERLTLMLGAGVLLLGLAYALILDPLMNARTKLDKRLPQLRAEVHLMRVQVAEIERLRASAKPAGQGALPGRVGVSATQAGIRDKLQQVVSIADDRVRVVGGPLSMTAWLAWLRDLEAQGIRVAYCRMSGAESGGHAVEALLQGEAR